MTPHSFRRAVSVQRDQEQGDPDHLVLQGRIVTRCTSSLSSQGPNNNAIEKLSLLHPSLVDPLDYRPLQSALIDRDAIESARVGPGPKHTSLSVYLYPEYISQSLGSEPLHFQMNRDSAETVAKTLERLEISLGKKVRAGRPNCKRKRQKKIWTRRAISDGNLDSRHTIWKADSGSDTTRLFEWKCRGLTNFEVWAEAMYSVMVVRIWMAELGETWNFLVESNPPTILSVRTFGDFGSNLFVDVPIKVSTTSCFASQVRVDWFSDSKLVKSSSHVFQPRPQDLGKALAILVTPQADHHDGTGQQQAYQFQRRVEALPENLIESIRMSYPAPDNHCFRVMTWNILANQNAFEAPDQLNAGFATHVGVDVLRKNRRMPLILHEILFSAPDIVCLQEVDECVYESLLQPTMLHFNYEGYYKCKVSRGNREGCAMFWSLDRFEKATDEDKCAFAIRDLVPGGKSETDARNKTQLHSDELEESSLSLLELFEKRPDLEELVREKLGHIVQICCLRVKNSSHQMVICNTHLFYHEEGSHIRLIQLYSLLQKLGEVAARDKAAMVLCGDLNSSLERGAGRLLTERELSANADDLKVHLNCYQWDEGDNGVDGDEKKTIDHNDNFPPIALPKSFPVLEPALEEPPPFTNFVVGESSKIFSAALDHIMIESEKLRCVRSAPMPSAGDVSLDTAMPSRKLPSDHVSLVADIQWKQAL